MKSIWGWLPLAIVTAGICVLSVVPPPTLETGDFEFGDKINHCAAMMTVVLMVVRAIRWQRGVRNPRRELVMGASYAFIFSVLIEIVQGWIPNRSSDLADLAADSVGIILGVLIALLIDAIGLGRLAFGPSTRRGDTPAAAE